MVIFCTCTPQIGLRLICTKTFFSCYQGRHETVLHNPSFEEYKEYWEHSRKSSWRQLQNLQNWPILDITNLIIPRFVISKKMANATEDKYQTTIPYENLHCRNLNESHHKIILLTLNIPIFITAFIGNVLIILALQKPSPLHPASKLLLGCLATTDLCISLIKQPLFVTYLMSKRCSYVGILSIITGGILIGVSLLTLATISMDRLLALVLGLRYRHVVTLRRVKVLIGVFWISNTVTAVSLPYSPRFAAAFYGVEVLFCAVTSTFCYTKIYRKLRHNQATVQGHFQHGHLKRAGIPLNIARYRKTVSSALWVQITLVVCFLPYGIVMAILAVSGQGLPTLALASTSTLLHLNSSLNPFLYCWKIREVRQAVKDTIRQLQCISS